MLLHNSALLKLLWNHLSILRKQQLWMIFLLMIVASLAEVVSVGVTLPFLGVLVAPEQIYQNTFFQPIIQILELTSAEQLIFPLTIGFISAVLIAGIIRIALLYTMNRFEQVMGTDLAIDVYRRTLYQSYIAHVGRNSSDVISVITGKTNTVITGVVKPMLVLISSTLVLIGVMSALIIIDIEVALSAFSGFALIYWGINKYTRKKLIENSQCINNESTAIVKTLQEGMGGIRDILIDGSQQFYCQLLRNSYEPYRRAIAHNNLIASTPRFVIEALGMTLIAGLAYYLSQQADGMITTIPILGALAMGAQRLLPALQQIYSSISIINGSSHSLQNVLDLLNQPLPDYANKPQPTPISFEKEIRLNDISFRYIEDAPYVLKHVNLSIAKGSCIGFIGKTGSGKSTLLDIIMGLLSPIKGTLAVDGKTLTMNNLRNWQSHIAHVPQDIYLADNTIEENIAFGQPKDEIDYNRVQQAAEKAGIAKLIESWPNQYQTYIGERGIRLSGGQRQRIGIARALYKQANVLILDEATSALDSKTEESVIKSIKAFSDDITVLMIAHRVTTLRDCDYIVEIDDDGSVRIGSYDDLCK